MTTTLSRPTFLAALTLLMTMGPAAAEYREIVVLDGGAIRGTVRVSGDVPKLPPQPVFKEHETCGETLPDERLLVGANGALRNAAVFLVDVRTGKAVPRSQPVTIDNLKCAFVPHVLTASAGQQVELHNSDPFIHDAHAVLDSRTLFNVAIPKGRTVRRTLIEPGLVHLNCNVRHTWMHGYIYVTEHPYHAVTDETGQFRIEDIPPGTYTLRVWHELLGSVDGQVVIESGKTAAVDMELQAAAKETAQ
ncbi:MAG TPA: carboxypeptidase regulatory-like domain-containing protein [Candidatus Binatia bacterium]|nr:carboxypeptidase regulatory-like domain-containing protein [Candidatus Binatia bacterium]